MGNELKGLPHHSAEYFGDTRDFWWNEDYIAALAKRWRLDEIRAVLDVGCGVGHWSRVLATVLSAQAHLTGVDREPLWIEKASERGVRAGLADRFHYRVASAEALPFADGTFDLVTCQTLLIHVRDPAAVLAEMLRVTKPGGLLLVAEPTNAVGSLVDAIALGDSPEVCAALVQFHLVCLRGKMALGEGDDLLGESLPRLLAGLGLQEVELRLNERPWALVPPYASPFERLQVAEALDLAERELPVWDEATTQRYYAAGGGETSAFATSWTLAIAQLRRVAVAIREQRFTRAGAGLFYLAWGRKPTVLV